MIAIFYYGIIYILLEHLFVFVSKKEIITPKDRNIIICVIFIASTLLGVRFVISDWIDYMVQYNEAVQGVESRSLEPIWAFLQKVMAFFHLHYSCFFSLIFMINISLVLFGVREIDRKYLPYTGLIFLTLLPEMSNIMRQAVALCIFVYSIQYIIKRDFKRYVIAVIIAMGFHSSAILVLPFYWIVCFKAKINVVLQLIIYAIFVFILPVLIKDLISNYIILLANVERYAYQVDNFYFHEGETNTGLGNLMVHLINVVVIIFSNRYLKNNPALKGIYLLYFITACISASIIDIGDIVSRFFKYGNYVLLIVLPGMMFHLFKKSYKGIYYFLLSWYVILLVYQTSLDTYPGLKPLHFFWENINYNQYIK